MPAIADLRRSASALRDELMQRMRDAGSLPLDFYPSFVRDDDPASGFAVGVAPPRFSTDTGRARNRIGVLVETHSWKDYPTRVRITRNSIVAMMEMAARDGRKWLQAAKTADEHAARVGGTSVALTYENTRARADDRLPRLRIHARAVGDLRRAADALRPEEAADLAHSAVR